MIIGMVMMSVMRVGVSVVAVTGGSGLATAVAIAPVQASLLG